MPRRVSTRREPSRIRTTFPSELRVETNAKRVKREVGTAVKRLLTERSRIYGTMLRRTRGAVITNNHNVQARLNKLERKIQRLRAISHHASHVPVRLLREMIQEILNR